jgi:hypothetical protein
LEKINTGLAKADTALQNPSAFDQSGSAAAAVSAHEAAFTHGLIESALQPGEAATPAQGAKAETALQPPAVSTLAIVAGAISTPLDGSAYRLTLSEDVASGWSAPLPSGGDASAQTYWASLDILPPASGGPFALSIPAEWQQAGPLDTIALAAGDVPISITLRTWGAADIAYSAGWVGA